MVVKSLKYLTILFSVPCYWPDDYLIYDVVALFQLTWYRHVNYLTLICLYLSPDPWHLISDTGTWNVILDTWSLTLDIDTGTWHVILDTWSLTLDIWHRYLTCYHLTPDTWHLIYDTWHLTCYHSLDICYHLVLTHLTWYCDTWLNTIIPDTCITLHIHDYHFHGDLAWLLYCYQTFGTPEILCSWTLVYLNPAKGRLLILYSCWSP